MKQFKRAFAMVLCVATLLSLCMVYASAGNTCSEITGTGKPSSSVTFTVTTNSKWGKNNLTITQTKGTAYDTMGDPDDAYEAYGLYKVTYKNSNGKEKTKRFTDDKISLDLKPNQTYTVTVRAYGAQLADEAVPWDTYVACYTTKGGFSGWAKEPVWKVSAEKNITLCQ